MAPSAGLLARVFAAVLWSSRSVWAVSPIVRSSCFYRRGRAAFVVFQCVDGLECVQALVLRAKGGAQILRVGVYVGADPDNMAEGQIENFRLIGQHGQIAVAVREQGVVQQKLELFEGMFGFFGWGVGWIYHAVL